MAKKSIISLSDLNALRGTLRSVSFQEKFNDHILQIIKVEKNKSEFKDLKIFTLGSLSYKGLCPYSDVDLLAVGDKNLAQKLSIALEAKLANVKIKWWPKLDFKLADGIFDHISLFFAQALATDDEATLLEFKGTQSKWIEKNLKEYQSDLFKDRHLRRSRYGAIGGELSPNIKYGPGGLRDTCQALAWSSWMGVDDFVIDLRSNLELIYETRFALQCLFETDQLTLDSWPELTKTLNWSPEDKRFFYQKMFEQFKLTDLIFENKDFKLSMDVNALSELKLKNFKSDDLDMALNSVNSENAKLAAYFIRNEFVKKIKVSKDFKLKIYEWMHELFVKPNADWQIDFILDSGLLMMLLPAWQDITGLVQSDHYHKYTVSEHLRQTLKAVCTLQNQKELRFTLSAACDDVSDLDWQTLKWVAIFHDLKKGHVEDHSLLGKIAVEDFPYFSEERKKAVSCLVEHHLKLSTFAFRFEHSDQQQLEILNELFEVSQWIRLLLVFTGADIIGSNPQAWNKWKSDQLYYAYKSLMDFRNKVINSDAESIGGFDLSPYLVKVLGADLLSEDIKLLTENVGPSGPIEDWLVESIDDNLWVRVYKKDSGPGTLSEILNVLYMAGLPVEQAFICSEHTEEKFVTSGYIYNWFRMPSTFTKPKFQIQARIKILSQQKQRDEKLLKAQIDKVIFLTENNGKLSFLFKGNDQSGVLLFISKIFESLDVDILKAQINTWGNRIEDLFVVKKAGHNPEKLLKSLNESLNLAQSIKI